MAWMLTKTESRVVIPGCQLSEGCLAGQVLMRLRQTIEIVLESLYTNSWVVGGQGGGFKLTYTIWMKIRIEYFFGPSRIVLFPVDTLVQSTKNNWGLLRPVNWKVHVETSL